MHTDVRPPRARVGSERRARGGSEAECSECSAAQYSAVWRCTMHIQMHTDVSVPRTSQQLAFRPAACSAEHRSRIRTLPFSWFLSQPAHTWHGGGRQVHAAQGFIGWVLRVQRVASARSARAPRAHRLYIWAFAPIGWEAPFFVPGPPFKKKLCPAAITLGTRPRSILRCIVCFPDACTRRGPPM